MKRYLLLILVMLFTLSARAQTNILLMFGKTQKEVKSIWKNSDILINEKEYVRSDMGQTVVYYQPVTKSVVFFHFTNNKCVAVEQSVSEEFAEMITLNLLKEFKYIDGELYRDSDRIKCTLYNNEGTRMIQYTKY